MRICKVLAAAAVATTSLAGSAFAAPVIFMYGAGGFALTENVSPKFEDVTHFGSVVTGGGSKDHYFYIRNHGDANLIINNVSLSGSGALSFAVEGPVDAIVAPNGFTSFKVTFDPISDGLKSAKVTVATNAPGNSLFEYNIAGTGAAFVPQKPDLDSGVITTVKSKTIEQNGVTYLKATYLVPISNGGSADYTKKTSFMKVFSSVDRFLDNSDTSALKALSIKKALAPGDQFNMKVKVKVEIPPGTQRIIFQIESPDDYEENYSDNLRFETYP